MKRVILLTILSVLGCSTSLGFGLLVVDEAPDIWPPERPGIPRPVLPRPIHRWTPFEIKRVEVTAKIDDQHARTKIEQEFYNPNARQMEGTFILPLPLGAHVSELSLEVDGRMMKAELLPAERARPIYEEIVRKAKDPALLEYVGRDLVKVRIFPIEPHATKRIEISYEQLLKNDGGLIAYTLPLNVSKHAAGAVQTLSLKVEIKAGAPLKTIYSPSHPIEVLRHSEKTATIGLEQTNIRPERDLQLFYSMDRQDVGLSLLTYKEAGEEGYFLLLATPGVAEDEDKVLSKDVVFVLDTSGSMAGKKLEQARKALSFCVNVLNRDDRFEIIRFATEAEALFRGLRPVSEASRSEALRFIEGLKPIGGTAINDALGRALALRPDGGGRPFLVVFLTDGQPTIGDTSEEGILKTAVGKRGALTRIFCFGIGTDVNTHLLDRLAEETSALSQYVLPDEDLEVKVSTFFSRISHPVLADVKLDFDSVRTSKMLPGKLPDLFEGQQLVVLGRYSSGAKARATVTGRVGERERSFQREVRFPEEGTEHGFIPKLWASRRVGHLLEEIRLRGESAELKEEVTLLARKYGLVTPYTSMLAQEDRGLTQDGRALSTGHESLALRPSRREHLGGYSPRGPAIPAEPRSGDQAVAGARYSGALKAATSEQDVRLAAREVAQYAATGRLQSSTRDEDSGSEPARLAGGRNFELKGGVWVDSTISGLKGGVAERIRFNSAEYWKLVSGPSEVREILALGPRVSFIWEGRLIEVVE
jgi:Ca-activated chloride channel family protein